LICNQWKYLSEFSKSVATFDKKQTRCKACQHDYHLLNWSKNKEKQYNNYLFRTYRLSRQQYEIMLEKQKNKCAICQNGETRLHKGRDTRLAVDHNHHTGHVRGLLCAKCNAAMGFINDNIQLAKAVVEYLEKFDNPK
jgi:Autographiviridae endonuclease VII